MRTLCIVPCGKIKIWDKHPDAGPTEARRVYIGPFASKCREYAEKFYPDTWYVLSAKYGFITPDFIIEGPYNNTFKTKRTNPISKEELAEQVSLQGLNDYENVVALGGEDYVGRVREVFGGREIVNPLSAFKRNGEMMKALKDAIERSVPIQSE